MIKKILLLALLSLATVTSYAKTPDRDILLVPDGTLYTIESNFSSRFPVYTTSGKLLQLTIQRGEQTTSMLVPASLAGGINTDPALAWDNDTQTLFVFWQRSPNRMSSELLFCTYSNGEWSEPTAFDKAVFNVRFNLNMTSTRWVTDLDDAGLPKRNRELILHAVWWEQTGYGEEARYAILTMERGKVTNIETVRLLDYVPAEGFTAPAELSPSVDRELLRLPAMTQNGSNDGVEIVFADWTGNKLHHVTMTPVRDRTANGVIRVPGGVWHGTRPAPRHNIGQNAASASTILSSSGTLAYFEQSTKELRYILLRDSEWTKPQSVSLNTQVSGEVAVEALRRMVAAE